MAYLEGLVDKYELKGCKLISGEGGAVLCTFDARAVADKQDSGGFVGAGLASGGQMFQIATAKIYDYEVYNHRVIIGGVQYVISAKQPVVRKTAGEMFCKPKTEILLTLE